MSKTLRRYSSESFLTCFKDLYRVSFVALQGEGSDTVLRPKDCFQCLYIIMLLE